MPIDLISWSLTTNRGETILGDTHMPESRPTAVAIVTHGFMGYKDYGFIPAFTHALAEMGIAASRYNLSHSGMTNTIDRFEKPELFAQNTYNRQVEDIERLLKALDTHELFGTGLPVFLVGHSRGGVASLLAAGRRAARGDKPPAGIITIAAPDHTSRLTPDKEQELDQNGYIEVTSNRTGQKLIIDRAFWDEQNEDPAGHDLIALASRITAPTLIIHGEEDETVPLTAGANLSKVIPNAELCPIAGGNHVLNTPNPFPIGGEPSKQLHEAIGCARGFLDRVRSPR